MQKTPTRRGLLRRAVAFLFLISVALTWVAALIMAFVTDPRRGVTATGDASTPMSAYVNMQTWESSTSSYVEALWQLQHKRAWGPEQAAGDPDTHGQGDIQTAWASATPDGQPEWLILRWNAPIDARSITVYQTYNPGAIKSIKVALADAAPETVWEGPTAPAPSATSVLVAPLNEPKRIDRVEVHIDSPGVPGWNEIDAVCITDTAGNARGADHVEASSTYASRSGHSGLPPIPAWCDLDQPSPAVSSGEVAQERRSAGAFGWPFHAWVASQATQVRRAGYGTQANWAPSPGPMRAIPYRPLFVGVALNAALIFGVLIVMRLLLFAPFRPAARLMRMQRGACVSCGYDLRYNFAAGCPECGYMRR
jgi:hypothetical protein